MTYDPITDKGSSLAVTDSNWTLTAGGVTTTMSIDVTGAITGSDTDGCVYNGTISIIDASVNIYGLTMSASSCGVYNGAYGGYAVIEDDTVPNDILVYTLSNANYITISYLDRI